MPWLHAEVQKAAMPEQTAVPVLLHGFLGFVRIGPIEYFRHVAGALRGDGIEVFIPQLPPAGSVAERAEALACLLRQHRASAFMLIGHSMGGLDARFLCAHLDPDRRVKAVVTVGTPHRGSAIAENLLEGWGILPLICRSMWRDALNELDPRTREREVIPDRADVAYVSYAASRPRSEIPLAIRLAVGSLADENDGLVSVDSARWGDFRGVVRADHFELVGWSIALPNRRIGRPFEHVAFWEKIVTEKIENRQADP
jgi:triacylglycerol lipase